MTKATFAPPWRVAYSQSTPWHNSRRRHPLATSIENERLRAINTNLTISLRAMLEDPSPLTREAAESAIAMAEGRVV